MRPLRILNKDRKQSFKCFRIFYLCLRAYYVAIYFYFLPFISMMASTFTPLIFTPIINCN